MEELERGAIQKRFDDLPGMNCFGCSTHRMNPVGLHLVFEETEQGARTFFSFPDHFQSYPGFIHGGILSTVLDESMFYAATYKLKVLAFTRRMETFFRSAAKPGVRYTCEAKLVESGEGFFKANARIKAAHGEGVGVVARSVAEFAIPTPAVAARLLGKEAVVRFLDFFPEQRES